MENKEIIQFLIRAKKSTYAGKGTETVSSRVNSHDLIYREPLKTRQERTARIFSSPQSLESGGILYVFPTFQTEAEAEKDRCSAADEFLETTYNENEYMYYDTYLGGNKFAGEEAVWIHKKPYWSMNYIGRVIGANFSGDFLKEALLRVPVDKPFRGPTEYLYL